MLFVVGLDMILLYDIVFEVLNLLLQNTEAKNESKFNCEAKYRGEREWERTKEKKEKKRKCQLMGEQ